MNLTLTPKQQEAQALMASAARYVLLVGGVRSGKTWLICRSIALRALKSEGSRHLIARFRFNHVKASIWHGTWPDMMKACFPDIPYKMNKQDFIIHLPNGSEIWFGGLDEKERTEKILGTEFATLFANECSQIGWSSIEMLKTRLAQVCKDYEGNQLAQRFFMDCNPPLATHWTHKLFIEKREAEPPNSPLKDPENYAWIRINPRDNAANLTPEFLASVEKMPARARQRFWDGEWGSANENALWTPELIEAGRVSSHPDLQRIIVAVDPSGTKGPEEDKRSDHVGIVVAGLGIDGDAYVLEDLTVQVRPSIWGRMVVSAFERHAADLIVGEANFGGAMVEDTIRSAAHDMGVSIKYKEVVSSRGKVIRAEPISTLYGDLDLKTRSRVHHVGRFPELEDQMCSFTTAGYMGDRSPDRADALVFALTEVFPGMTRKVPRRPGVQVEGIGNFSAQRF